MTTARTVCAGCGAVAQIGASLAYTRAPGTVVCCADCGTALMRLVHGEGRYWIDLRGASCVEIPEWTRSS